MLPLGLSSLPAERSSSEGSWTSGGVGGATLLLDCVSASPFGEYNLDRGLSEGGTNADADPASNEGGLNIDRGPDPGAEAIGVERNVELGVKGVGVRNVGRAVNGVAGEVGRAVEFGVGVVRLTLGCSSSARPLARKPAGEGGTNADGVPVGLGNDMVSDGGRKALRAPAAEGTGVPSVRLAIAPLRSRFATAAR